MIWCLNCHLEHSVWIPLMHAEDLKIARLRIDIYQIERVAVRRGQGERRGLRKMGQ